MGAKTGILLDDTVGVMDESLPGDMDASGVTGAMECRFVSHDLSFVHGGASIRPYAVLVCADADAGQRMLLTLRAAGGKMATVALQATEETPCEMQKRVSVGRCRHARLELQCDCLGKLTLGQICVTVGT